MISFRKITIQNGLGFFAILTDSITILFNIGWIIHCIRMCWVVAKKYRMCKQTLDLHPVFKDVQYLSRQRNLYNLKTHFVKYILIIMCLSVEAYGIIWSVSVVAIISEDFTTKLDNELNSILSKYPHCYLSYHAAYVVSFLSIL